MKNIILKSLVLTIGLSVFTGCLSDKEKEAKDYAVEKLLKEKEEAKKAEKRRELFLKKRDELMKCEKYSKKDFDKFHKCFTEIEEKYRQMR